MYKLEFAKSFEKDFKKLAPEAQREFFDIWAVRLQENPYIGERMKGKALKKFMKCAFRFKQNDYRVVYWIHEKRVCVILLAIGSRENFYKRLGMRFS